MLKTHVFFSFFLAVFLISGTFSYGQKKKRKNVFSFSGGYSLPVGKFASEALDDPRAGMADDGYFGRVSYERILFPGVGLRLSANHNINRTNPDPLIRQAGDLVEMYRGLIGETGQYSWTSDAQQWRQTSLMLGPALFIPIGPLSVEAHVQGGRLFITSPKVTLEGTSTSGNNPITAVMMPVKTQSWGFAGGLSLRIPLGPVVQLKLFAEAIAANATFKDIALRGTIGGVEVTQNVSEKRAVGVVNTGAGLAFRF